MLSDYINKTTHGSIKSAIHFLGGRAILKRSIFHATSHSEEEECKKMIRGWKGFTAYNVVNLPDLMVKRKDNPVFTIIFLSRIHPKKGLEQLMQAIAKIKIPIILRVAGTGDEDYVEDLKRLSKQLGINRNVHWLGWSNREDKFIELMNADLFALTSYNENFGNVVIESLYAGTPVLISKHVGLQDFVGDNELGWVCDLTIESIVENLKLAMNKRAKREWITHVSKAYVDAAFDKATLVEKYLCNYKKYSKERKSCS